MGLLEICRHNRTRVLITVPLLILFLLFTGYATYEYIEPSLRQPGEDLGLGPVETPTLMGNYSAEDETLTITVVNGSFTRKSTRVAFRSHKDPYHETKTNKPSESEFTIQGYGKVQDNHIWASRSVLETGIGNWGITGFPIEEGESITVVSEGTDRDGDGNKGVENGEEIDVISKDHGYNAQLATFGIVNDTAVCSLIRDVETHMETYPNETEHERKICYA